MSANALYSIVNSLASSMNAINSDILHIKSKLSNTPSTAPAVVSAPATHVVQAYDDAALRTQIKMVEESVKKSVQQLKEESGKERTLVETTLSHKLEQHFSRLVKERIEILREEMKQYVDSKSGVAPASTIDTTPQLRDELKRYIDTKVAAIPSPMPALREELKQYVESLKPASEAPEPSIEDNLADLDLNTVSVGDFEIDIKSSGVKKQRSGRRTKKVEIAETIAESACEC